MWGDVRIPFSVQHNVGSVENLDGVIFFQGIHHDVTHPAGLVHSAQHC